MSRPAEVAVALVLLAVLPSRGDTCSCADVGAQALLKGAEMVFSGEAVKAEIIDGGGNPVVRNGRTVVAPAEIVTFRVHEVWKGDVREAVKVWNLVGPPGNCGVNVRIGEKYLVFARGVTRDPRWDTSTMLCFGTGHFREARTRRNVKDLGKPTRVTPATSWWGDLLELE